PGPRDRPAVERGAEPRRGKSTAVRIVGAQYASTNDAELIRSVAEGRLEGLGQLFDRYHLPVRRFLARMQMAPGDLDDLVQVTFLDVPRAAAHFDPSRSAKAWL